VIEFDKVTEFRHVIGIHYHQDELTKYFFPQMLEALKKFPEDVAFIFNSHEYTVNYVGTAVQILASEAAHFDVSQFFKAL
jgi:hypothetical protein